YGVGTTVRVATERRTAAPARRSAAAPRPVRSIIGGRLSCSVANQVLSRRLGARRGAGAGGGTVRAGHCLDGVRPGCGVLASAGFRGAALGGGVRPGRVLGGGVLGGGVLGGGVLSGTFRCGTASASSAVARTVLVGRWGTRAARSGRRYPAGTILRRAA